MHKKIEVLENTQAYFGGLSYHIYHYKRLKFYHKLIFWLDYNFYFSIRRAIAAYVSEIRLSQYILSILCYPGCHVNAVHCLYCNSCTWSSSNVIVMFM